MKRHWPEPKEAVLKNMLAPHNRSVEELSEE